MSHIVTVIFVKYLEVGLLNPSSVGGLAATSSFSYVLTFCRTLPFIGSGKKRFTLFREATIQPVRGIYRRLCVSHRND